MRFIKSLFIIVIVFVFTVYSFANSSTSSIPQDSDKYPSIQPIFTAENELGYTPSQILSADEVFKLSLLFSECPLKSRSAQLALQKFEQIKKVVSSEKYMNMSEEERGDAILKFLYQGTLLEYNEDQSKVSTIFESGYYNCVSSALLYMATAKAAGLEVKGQKTPLHAFCSVYIKDEKTGKKHRIDVETTNPYGFNPGSKGTVETEQNMTMYYFVPKSNYSDRQEVSDKIFTGLIANNLRIDYLDVNDYSSAIPLMCAFYNLIKDEKSYAQQQIRDDFYGILCNYLYYRSVDLSLYSASEYAEIVYWFASFIERWGKNNVMQMNMDSSFINLLVLCYEENDYNLANDIYKKLKPFISSSQLPEAEEIVTELFLSATLDDIEPQDKITIINELLDSTSITKDQRKRFLTELENAWIDILTERMNNYEFRDGYADSIKAESQIPKSSVLKQIKQLFYTNCIVEIHNNFVTQFNKGNYQEARKILEQGIIDFPKDETLKQDLAVIKKMPN